METVMKLGNWTLKLVPRNEIMKLYKDESSEDEGVRYVFGMTSYPTRTIFINREMHEDQIIQTLKHELTHAYIWEAGLYNAPHYTDEMVCDIVACSNDYINSLVKEFKENVKENDRKI